MKTRTFHILLIAAIFSFTSCDKIINPSGNVTAEEYFFGNYNAIDISDAFTAFITFTPDVEGIVIEADDNIHEYVDIKVLEDRLYIGVERNFNISGPATLKAYIGTDNVIGGIYASGATRITLEDELVGGTARLEASGASYISGTVDLDRMSANLSGASLFVLAGTADEGDVSCSGASSFHDYDLVFDDLDIMLSGASNARITMNNIMNASASGASTILYKGDGVIDQLDVSGASTVMHVD